MEKISPEEYREILDGLELKDILVSNIKADIKHEYLSDGLKIKIKNDANYLIDEDDDLIITIRYKLSANSKEKKSALKIEATYIAVFDSVKEITDDFFDVYKEISLPLNIWPFFRELVNSTTARMNVPPLTLPLLKR